MILPQQIFPDRFQNCVTHYPRNIRNVIINAIENLYIHGPLHKNRSLERSIAFFSMLPSFKTPTRCFQEADPPWDRPRSGLGCRGRYLGEVGAVLGMFGAS